MEDESALVVLIQHYANRFGITFDSKLMDDEVLKPKLIRLLSDAVCGKRGAVTDQDVLEAP